MIDKNNFLHSGDLGIKDEDGNYRITGRIKDMIIRGGENIYPREIEEFGKVKDVHLRHLHQQENSLGLLEEIRESGCTQCYELGRCYRVCTGSCLFRQHLCISELSDTFFFSGEEEGIWIVLKYIDVRRNKQLPCKHDSIYPTL